MQSNPGKKVQVTVCGFDDDVLEQLRSIKSPIEAIHFSIAREFTMTDYENLSKAFRKGHPIFKDREFIVDV